MQLINTPKPKLVELIATLQLENSTLNMVNTMDSMNQRLIDIERKQNLSAQYGRRNCIELTGIPSSVPDQNLENEVIKIYNQAGFKVHGQGLSKQDIEACHRIGKKGKTIARMVNRKFAEVALYNGKNLKDINMYEHKVYVNNSFCREFNNINYILRSCIKKKTIYRFKIKHGVHYLKLDEDGDFTEISHISDLENLGVDIA